ncbi:alpha/beta hydrolase [Sphingobacteriaceae bacterium]|nr:alpha/beta hydrolase [Sphingobacteriaceae bacterium]
MRDTFKINLAGSVINYEDSQKQTLPVIFIHGFPFSKESWRPQFEFLKETHRVIIYDLPGFGGSTTDTEETSISFFADNLIHFMDALQIEKAVVCGLSMGGYILLNAVERYQDRFEAIILSDTQCVADTDEGAKKRYDTIKEIEAKGLNEFTEGFVKKAFSKETQAKKAELVESIKQVILSNPQKSITAALKAMAGRKETCSGLENISLPTLILCGEEDELTPVAQSQKLFDAMPNAEIHIIASAGHLSNLEQEEVFNDHLHNFISDIIL